MDFGIDLATSADSWKVVKRAEQLGYAAPGSTTRSSQRRRVVAMGAAAVQTVADSPGPGVLIPSNRIAPVAASALASLNALAPGRINFGISTGFTARRTMGLGPVKLDDMAEYIHDRAAPAGGRDAGVDARGQAAEDPLPQPGIRRREPAGSDPAAHLGAGPARRELTAQLGAGWIYATGHVGSAEAAAADMQAAWRARRRTGRAAWPRRSRAEACWRTARRSTAARQGPGRAARHDRAPQSRRGRGVRCMGRRCRRRCAPLSSATGRSTRVRAGRRVLPVESPWPPHGPQAGGARGVHGGSDPHADVHRPPRRAAGAYPRAAHGRVHPLRGHIRHGHPEMLEEWADVLEGVYDEAIVFRSRWSRGAGPLRRADARRARGHGLIKVHAVGVNFADTRFHRAVRREAEAPRHAGMEAAA